VIGVIGQGRFTQVDPIGMAAASSDPQSNNLYANVQNIPTDLVDPSGLVTHPDAPYDPALEGKAKAGGLAFTVASGGTVVEFESTPYWFRDGQLNLGTTWSDFWFYSNYTRSGRGSTDSGAGPSAPAESAGPADDPNSEYCKARARTIANLQAQIERRVRQLIENPQGLPEHPPYPGAPLRASRQGHRQMISDDMDNLRTRRDEYSRRCGGGPPPSSSPAPVPLRKPTAPRSTPRITPRVPIPVRPFLFPFIILPPGIECVLGLRSCGSNIVA
jgi:hypothetical protein